MSFRFIGNPRILNAANVDEYWVGTQGMSTLPNWPSLNSPENELAYGDFPSGLLLGIIKMLDFFGQNDQHFFIYILMYRSLSVIALFGLYIVLSRYPNKFDPEIWKIASRLVFIFILFWVNEINALAKPDALSLFLVALFIYAINPKSSFNSMPTLKYILVVGLVGALLISTKFFGFILLPITCVIAFLTLRKNTLNQQRLNKKEINIIGLMTFVLPFITIVIVATRLILLGSDETNRILLIKWSIVPFGNQQAYSYRVILIASALILLLVALATFIILKKSQSFGMSQKIIAAMLFTIPLTALINFDGLMSLRLLKSVYFLQLKTSNGHFIREKDNFGFSFESWDKLFLLLVLISIVGLFLTRDRDKKAFKPEIPIFIVLILFFSTRTITSNYLFPLLPFIAIGITNFISAVLSKSKSSGFFIINTVLLSLAMFSAVLNSQYATMNPEKYNPKVAIGYFLDRLAGPEVKVYADAEMYVPIKFNNVTSSWSGKWSDAKGADFLLLSGVLIDTYGVIREESDVVNKSYLQSYEFYSGALSGQRNYCRVATWKDLSTYSILLTNQSKLCRDREIQLKEKFSFTKSLNLNF
jgi:hypothetical protein